MRLSMAFPTTLVNIFSPNFGKAFRIMKSSLCMRILIDSEPQMYMGSIQSGLVMGTECKWFQLYGAQNCEGQMMSRT